MRNTKIALAVLALVASTAAMAQATVYGHIDASVSKQTDQTTQFGEGNWDSSRFGVKGSEDLDGGMKVNYNLEIGYNSGNGQMFNGGTALGALPNPVFNRAANVGLSGDFGTVTLGLQISPAIGAALAGAATGSQSFNVNMLAMAGAVALTANPGAVLNVGSTTTSGTLPTGGFFIPNAISYTTPNIGGFSGTVLTQAAAAGSTDTNGQKYTSGAVNYAAGDVNVSASYSKTEVSLFAVPAFGIAAGTVDNKTLTIAGGYRMGAAKIGGGYITVDTAGAADKLNTYYVSLGYDVASNTNVSLNYARNNATVANSIINLGAKYDLSKRTYAYGTISRADGANALYSSAAAPASGTVVTGYGVGVGHSF
jgi:predicted porin